MWVSVQVHRRGITELASAGSLRLRALPEDSYKGYIPAITTHYAERGFEPYKWLKADDPPPRAPGLRAPLEQCRLGLVGTAGAYVSGDQRAFHYKDDTSVREIPSDTPAQKLHFSHITENYLVAARSDPGLVYPLEELNVLHRSGRLGALAPNALSCMGGIYSARRVRDELVPAVLGSLQRQHVDAALFVPM